MNSLQPGQSLLHFRIVDKIGQGGMGEVYKAQDLKLGRTVAIKVLPSGAVTSEKARLRFLQEARSASALNHPNIVTIYSIENLNDMDFIVMEFVEGKKLTEIVNVAPIQLETLIDIGIQMAEALAAAHAAGIIHRDIKTENILLTARGQVKVLDFGLAKIWFSGLSSERTEQETLAQITEAGTLLGTAHYMSPEQARGESLDPRTDVFSLGCVLYQSATGRLPFVGSSLPAVLLQIATVDPPLPSTFRPDLPAKFDSLVQRALSKNREERYPSGAEIAAALKELAILRSSASMSAAITQARPPIALVGRDADYEHLRGRVAEVLNHQGRIVLLSGEPGIGKSALAEEFLRTVSRSHPQFSIGRGRCVEQYGTAQAYLPFTDAVASLLSGHSRERMISTIRTHAPTWHAQFPAAFASTGALEKSQTESIGASKERMLREIAEALFDFASGTPLLLVLEDLHWADPSSVDLLRYLSQRLIGKRLFILGTARTDDIELNNPAMRSCLLELRGHNLADEIVLAALSNEDITGYLNKMFSPNQFPGDLSSLIHSKTEGHPLFVTSLLQFLTSQGDLRKDGEMWMLARPASEMRLDVPENVASMIRKKIDALAEEDRRALQYASVEGEEFTSTLLAELLEADEIDTEEQLFRLAKAHRMITVVGEEELPDRTLTTRYRFVHSLYQSAFYSDLVAKRRILLHRKAGDSLLKHYRDSSTNIANRLGGHFEIGRDHARAAEFLTLAADNAARIYANAEAIILYDKALRQIDNLRLEESDAKWEETAQKLCEKLGDALALSGQHAKAHHELERSLNGRKDPIDIARLRRKIAKVYETERKFPEAFAGYKEAERILEDSRTDAPLWWREWLQVGLDRQWLHYTQNQLGELEALIEKLEPFLMQHASADQRARFFFGVVLAGYRKERYFITDKNLEYCRRFVDAAEESGNLYELGGATFALGFAHMWKGDFAEASDGLQRSLQLAVKLGDRILESRCRTYLSVLLRKKGDVQATRDATAVAMELAHAINMMEYVATGHANLAWIAAKEGQISQVLENANKALEIWAGVALAYPFQSLALWPLIELELQQERYQQLFDHARLMLRPEQQKFSNRLSKVLEQAIAEWDEGKQNQALFSLRESLKIAREEFQN